MAALACEEFEIPLRTGVRGRQRKHPNKGAFFTRGTSRNHFAGYTEKPDDYVDNMQRLEKKMVTAAQMLPAPEVLQSKSKAKLGLVYFGTTAHAIQEAMDRLINNRIQFVVYFPNEIKAEESGKFKILVSNI